MQYTATNHYPFGMVMPGTDYSDPKYSGRYRYGFNGMERDDEMMGEGNSLDFGARIYDSRLGRWLAVDRMEDKYPDQSPYNYALNIPTKLRDPNGGVVTDEEGRVIFTKTGKEKVYYHVNIAVQGTDGTFYAYAYSAVEGYIRDNEGNRIPCRMSTSKEVRLVPIDEANVVKGQDGGYRIKDADIVDKDNMGILIPHLDGTANCAGVVIGGGQTIINTGNKEFVQGLKNDGWTVLADDEVPEEGDMGVYKNASGQILHVVTYDRNGNVTSKGGIAPYSYGIDPSSDEAWRAEEGTTYSVLRQRDHDVIQSTFDLLEEKINGNVRVISSEDESYMEQMKNGRESIIDAARDQDNLSPENYSKDNEVNSDG